ncbi:N-formylglutamate deformylase [Altererythrobacter sp. B11]|uniref:N-formylglutamate deformylase n=1 Tax=Altererythrobacter sp. B11 TaxID=2060312 RepID=UPI000DC730DD|nr:N-formylglutamate deformylase [Altererythrobacter sp. B11]BBC73393.1 N-formylglutamate deformylase [Altererythrobacter sp. B11]
MTDWLTIHSGDAPLVVTIPHAGTDIPEAIVGRFVSPWHARKDADWHVDALYAFARELGATTIATSISRSVIDTNRDPSGASLYPGQATTGLCPITDFDGHALYRQGCEPDDEEIAQRRSHYFDPYHAAIERELARLRAQHERVVLYDAHSIRSHVPRLFEGTLPLFNIGTNSGLSCAPSLAEAVTAPCAASGQPWVLDGRFRGGWTTRHYGCPAEGLHAVQMELAMRGYLDEPDVFEIDRWPALYDPIKVEALQPVLHAILQSCLDWTTT